MSITNGVKSLQNGFVVYGCKTCGTRWEAKTKGNIGNTSTTGWTGFLEANMYSHWEWCKVATPDERLAWAIKTEKRLKKKPNLHTHIFIDLQFLKHDAALETKP